MTNSEQDLKTFMAVAGDVATARAKLMPTTPDIRRRAAALVAFGHEKIAEMRREELATRPTNIVTGTIREWILKLIRSELMTELTAVWTAHPELQFAHRESTR
jgi:hypothetical protein